MQRPPGDYVDPVLEIYKIDADRVAVRQTLKLVVEQHQLPLEQPLTGKVLRDAEATAADRTGD